MGRRSRSRSPKRRRSRSRDRERRRSRSRDRDRRRSRDRSPRRPHFKKEEIKKEIKTEEEFDRRQDQARDRRQNRDRDQVYIKLKWGAPSEFGPYDISHGPYHMVHMTILYLGHFEILLIAIFRM